MSVAGLLYPASSSELRATVDVLLAKARPTSSGPPKALIVPHAGYVYSGAVAASAFAQIATRAPELERIVLVGPSHRVYVDGLAWPGSASMSTPLGDMPIDRAALRGLRGVNANGAAHAHEHSLEVMLPFLQILAPNTTVIPLVTCDAEPAHVGAVLEALWGGPETLIVISSDLSHHLPYEAGRARDEQTAARILSFEPNLRGDEACGAAAINGLSALARKKHLQVELVDLRSSGDTAGDRDQVVGYGAFAVHEAA